MIVQWCLEHDSFQINAPYHEPDPQGGEPWDDPGSCWAWEMADSETAKPQDHVMDCRFVDAVVLPRAVDGGWPAQIGQRINHLCDFDANNVDAILDALAGEAA